MNRVASLIMLPFNGSVLRRNVVYTFGRQIIAALAQFLTVVIIARQLGAEGNGQYAMAILLPNLLVNFLNLGIGPANVFYLGRREVSLRHATRENIKIAAAIACAGSIGAFILVRTWGNALFPGIPLEILYIGLSAFPIALLAQYLRTLLQGVEDFKAFNLATLAPPLTTLLYICIAIFGLGLGLTGAVAGFALGHITGLFVVGFYLRRYFKKENDTIGTYDNAYKSKSFSYGWRAHFSNILAFVNYRADIFLVNLFLTPVATGTYVVAVKIAEQLWMLSKAASTVLLPRLSAMHENPQARLRLTNKAFAGVGGG